MKCKCHICYPCKVGRIRRSTYVRVGIFCHENGREFLASGRSADKQAGRKLRRIRETRQWRKELT